MGPTLVVEVVDSEHRKSQEYQKHANTRIWKIRSFATISHGKDHRGFPGRKISRIAIKESFNNLLSPGHGQRLSHHTSLVHCGG